MKQKTGNIYLLAGLFFLITTWTSLAGDDEVLNHTIKLNKNKDTVYRLLKQVSDQSGYLFIYDSQIIDNDKEVKVARKEYALRDAIYAITGYDQLKITIVGNHILLQLPEKEPEKVTVHAVQPEPSGFFTVGGTIHDRLTEDPVAYASVGVKDRALGTVSNQNGEFRLVLPDSLRESVIKFIHVGYENQEVEARLVEGQSIRFTLEPKVIPLQEVVIRVVDPMQVLSEMMNKRKTNYSSDPVYMTAFYREGVDHKNKNINLTEAVLKVYKTGYKDVIGSDQVKLLRMRHVQNKQENDTIYSKMKSGISSCLLLDIIKNVPDFLAPDENGDPFIYTHTDISVIDDRRVNVISFVQKEPIKDPLYEGQLYIDAENQALLEADFRINPAYIEKATDSFVERKSKDLKLTLQSADYTVSYKSSADGVYYINHIRGDLEFRVKKKRRLFSSGLHMWFEMVICRTDTDHVTGFPKNERISTRNIFSETKYKYDKDFWGNFNIILPEDKLNTLIINNLNQVVEGQGESPVQ